jgi:hypothetical protein
VAVDAYTRAHDAVLDALRQVDAAYRLRQENPELLRHALDYFHEASRSFAKAVELQEADASKEG